MAWEIPDSILKGGLFQRAVLTAETNKLCIMRFSVLFARISCALCCPFSVLCIDVMTICVLCNVMSLDRHFNDVARLHTYILQVSVLDIVIVRLRSPTL